MREVILRYLWVDQTRIIAAFAVICIHACSPLYLVFSDTTMAQWWLSNIIISFSESIANPVFVMISGYLILGKTIDTRNFYHAKISRLLPAIIFWSCLYTIFSYIFISHSLHDALWQISLGFILTGKTYFHLWYLSMFICLIFFAPFINKWITGEKASLTDFKILLCLFLAITTLNLFSDIKAQFTKAEISWFKVFPWYLIYFIAGHFIGKYSEELKVRTEFLALIFLSCIAIGCTLNYVAAKNGILKDNLILGNDSVLGLIASTAAFLIFSRHHKNQSTTSPLETVANVTFGIYLIHPAILFFVQHKLIANSITPIPSTLLSIPLTFILSGVIIYYFRKLKFGRLVT